MWPKYDANGIQSFQYPKNRIVWALLHWYDGLPVDKMWREVVIIRWNSKKGYYVGVLGTTRTGYVYHKNTKYRVPLGPNLRLSQSFTCAICLETGSSYGHNLKCGHTFHIFCINTWYKRNRSCPCCRANI